MNIKDKKKVEETIMPTESTLENNKNYKSDINTNVDASNTVNNTINDYSIIISTESNSGSTEIPINHYSIDKPTDDIVSEALSVSEQTETETESTNPKEEKGEIRENVNRKND